MDEKSIFVSLAIYLLGFFIQYMYDDVAKHITIEMQCSCEKSKAKNTQYS